MMEKETEKADLTTVWRCLQLRQRRTALTFLGRCAKTVYEGEVHLKAIQTIQSK